MLLNIFSHSQSAHLPVFLTYPYRVGEGGEGMNHELQRFNQIIMNFSIQSLGIMNHEIQVKTNHEYRIKGYTRVMNN